MHLVWRGTAPGDGPEISTSITKAESEELSRLAEGRAVLEIGSAFGYSSCLMALAGAEHVTAVDLHTWIPGSYESMMANLGFYGIADKVTVMREPSQSAMPKLKADGRRFGLIFVDGDHSKPAVAHDVVAALELLEPHGVLACHDLTETCCCAGVGEALAEVFPRSPSRLIDTLAVFDPAIVAA